MFNTTKEVDAINKETVAINISEVNNFKSAGVVLGSKIKHTKDTLKNKSISAKDKAIKLSKSTGNVFGSFFSGLKEGLNS